jgi:hypothetical protein
MISFLFFIICISASVVGATTVGKNNNGVKMKKTNWIETEQEFEVDAAGKKILKKTKHVQAYFTPRKKELFDFCLRLIGSLSILIPLLLLYFQRNNEIDKENRLALTSVYTGFSKDVTIWNDNWKDSIGRTDQIDSLYNSYIPKLNVYGNNKLANAFTGLYQSAYLRSQLHRLNMYIFRLIDSVGAFYQMMDLPEKDTTYTIDNDDYEDDSAALFLELNKLDTMNIHLSELRATVASFLHDEEERYSLDTLRQDSVLLSLDSLEDKLFELSSVPITSLASYRHIKSQGVDTFSFTIKPISIPFFNKILYYYSNLIEQNRLIDTAYKKEVRQFQAQLLTYIR